MPRRHERAGNRPPGPRSLDALLAELGLPSDRTARLPLTSQRDRADETARQDGADPPRRGRDADEAREAASAKYHDRSNGSAPVNDRHTESRPQSRTAHVHVPERELEDEAELRELNRAWVRERVSCSHCGAGVGELCRGRRGDRASNHVERLALAWVRRG